VVGVDWERRRVLQQAGTLAGLVLLGRLRWLPSSISSALIPSQQPSTFEGELWEGFLLLPPSAPVPSFVQCAPAPILCQTDERVEPDFRGETLRFDHWEDLKNRIQFPLYIPSRLPSQMTVLGAYLTIFRKSGLVFSASVAFGKKDGEPLIRIAAQPIYPSPYPIWPVYSPSQPEVPIDPEKVAFTPTPGLLLPSALGHVALWLERDVLYMLIAEHEAQRGAAIEVVQSLRQVDLR